MTDVTKHIIQGIALILVFGAKVIEKWRSKGSDLEKAQAERLYWGILILGLVIALTTEFYEAYDNRITQALRKATDATLAFNDKLGQVRSDPSEFPALEPYVLELEAARKELLPYGKRTDVVAPLIRATNDLGIGQERLAYGRAERGCRYFLDGDRLQSCQKPIGSQMGPNVKDMKYPGAIRCTEIRDKDMWENARGTLSALNVLIDRASSNAKVEQKVKELIPKAARTVGYFYLCDYLRNGRWDSLQSARKAWELFERKTDKATISNTYPDMPEKIRVMRAIEALADPSQLSALCSSKPCPFSID
jgi:hypothetical protein